MNINYDYIESYISSFYKDGPLRRLGQAARHEGVPAVENSTALFLKFLCRFTKPDKVLEIGTATGYSAILMQKASGENTKVISLEKDEGKVIAALENIKRAGLFEKISVILGDAKDTLTKLDDRFDLIFIDASKGQYKLFFNQSLKLLNKGGIIVCDNILFRGMVANDDLVIKKYKTLVNKLRDFINDIMNDERLNACILPVGDGVLLCFVNEENSI